MKLRILAMIILAFFFQALLLIVFIEKMEAVPDAAGEPLSLAQPVNAKTVNLVMGDQVTTLSTGALLVKEVLQETGILLDQDDRILPGLEEPFTDTIRIIDVKREILTQEADVPFSTEQKTDSELFKGEHRVIQKGKKGVERQVFEVTYEDGKEVGRKLREKVIVKTPVKQVVALGTRQTVSRSGSTLEFDRAIQMKSTGYTHTGRMTHTDIWPAPGIAAVDPRVIPLGTKLYIDGYGFARAMDTGGAIKGNRIDLFFDTKEEALRWGRRSVTVFVLK